MKVSLITSNDGNCYLLQHDNESICWIHKMNPQFSCKAEHDSKAYEYIYPKVDLHGKVCFFHHKGSSPETDISNYIDQFMMGNSARRWNYTKYVDSVKLDPTTGVECVNRLSNVFVIKRSRYIMFGDGWNVNVGLFEASYVDHDNLTSIIHVWQALSPDTLFDACRIWNYKNESGASMKDLNLHLRLKDDIISRTEDPVSLECELVHGTFNGYPAAIQVCETNVNISKGYKTLLKLSTIPNENILAFLGANVDVNGNYMWAFELFDLPLAIFARAKYETLDEDWLNVLRGVVEGILHLHSHELAHGNLNPWSVLVTPKDVPEGCISKLCELDKLRKLTPESENRDYFALGKLIVYLFTYPSLMISKDEYTKRDLSYNNMHKYAREARDVAMKLMESPCRIDLIWVLRQPMLWNAEKWLIYFKEVHQLIKNGSVDEWKLNRLSSSLWDTRYGWDSRFEDELLDQQDPLRKNPDPADPQRRNYKYHLVTGLIRFIRNIYSQQLEVERGLHRDVHKASCVQLVVVFRKAYPDLLMCVYNELKNQKLDMGFLSRFY